MSSDVKIKIVQPSGILDSTKAAQFRSEINELINELVAARNALIAAKESNIPPNYILIDFRDVTFMDSSGLGGLVLALKSVRSADFRLVVCSINEQIRLLFELTSMDRVFAIFPNREAFYTSIDQTEGA